MKNVFGLVLLQLSILVCTEGWWLLPATRTTTCRLLAQTYSIRRDRPTFLSTVATIMTDESINNNNSDIASPTDDPSTSERQPVRRDPPPLQKDDNEEFLPSSDSNSIMLHAAATVTQESCQLLGIKSVGVDYGLVRTGVAVTVGYDPKPLAILTDLNATQVSQQVVRYCRTEQATRVIVGLPLHKNGTVAEQTNLTLRFSQELAKHVLSELGPDVPVLLWDERYTSKEAAARAHSRDPGRYLYGTLDAESACIILEYYYKDNGLGSLQVEIEDKSVQRQCLEVYKSSQLQEQSRRQDAINKQDYRIQQRKEAIARTMRADAEKRAINEGDSNKKRKKKKKRR